MKIEILGAGCKSCAALEVATRTALDRLGLDVPVERVTDYAQIAGYGVMSIPALVVNEEVRTVGRVPSVWDLVEIIGGDAADV